MDPSASSRNRPGAIDFERATMGEASGALTCSSCGVPVGDGYYMLGEAIHCPRCRDQVAGAMDRGAGLLGWVRAGGFGITAAALGSLLWMGVAWVTGYELGLIAIAVGWAVGIAVKIGSGGRGGVPFQLLAVAMTYLAIVSSYVPIILQSWQEMPVEEWAGQPAEIEGEEAWDEAQLDSDALVAASLQPGPAAIDDSEVAVAEEVLLPVDDTGRLRIDGAIVVSAFVLALVLPFMLGFENAIGILIIGIALFEAWRQARATKLEISGPYRVGDLPNA